LKEKFETHIRKEFPEIFDNPIVLAVSGGLDSMVLLHLLKQLECQIIVAHCNFNLRGEDSNADALFVEKHCAKLGIHCLKKEFNTAEYIAITSLSTQEAARNLRYTWFNELCSKEKALLVTAHHSNDLIETFFINLERGAGLNGLSSIPEKINFVRRPLLNFKRTEIYEFAKKEKISWREDISNQSNKYKRNVWRNKLLPQITKAYPGIEHQILQSITHLKTTHNYIEAELKRFEAQCILEDYKSITIVLNKLSDNDEFLLESFLVKKGFFREQLKRIIQAKNDTGKRFFSATHEVVIGRGVIHVFNIGIQECQPIEFQLSELPNTITFKDRLLEFKILKKLPSDLSNPNIAYFDLAELSDSIIFRDWEIGDKIQPIGMNGMKKISDVFVDLKWSEPQKRSSILCSNKQGVLWLIGYRSADFCKVTSKTEMILSIRATVI